LPSLRKAKVVESDQMGYFEKKVYLEILRTNKNKNLGADHVHALWKNIPSKFQKSRELICAYVELLLPYPDQAIECESLLRHVMKNEWTNDAVRLYGLLTTPAPPKQLAKAESWLIQKPNDATLFLTLARLSMKCQLWGKARDYYDSSLKLEMNPETYAEYGALLESLGDHAAATRVYKDGLGLKPAVTIAELQSGLVRSPDAAQRNSGNLYSAP
jgi:HemY protein